MGLETKTIARQGRKKFEGKLYLDSKALTFRSPDLRLDISLGSTVEAAVSKHQLVVVTSDDKFRFDVGESASRWAEKINNPPSRATKLGIKPNQKLWLSPGFDKLFRDELKSNGAKSTRKIENCDLAFWKITHREQLDQFEELTDQIEDGINLWIVWTKGSENINQTEVMTTARSFGFGPSKTAAFDESHSSMRFARKKK